MIHTLKCNSENCQQFFYNGQLPAVCPKCGSSCSELKFDAAYPARDIEVYKDSSGIRWQLIDYKLIRLPLSLQPWPQDPRRSIPGTWWPAALILILLAILLPGSRIQGQIYQSGSYSYPFTLHTLDSNHKETGYFKFDPAKKTVVTRGSQPAVFGFFLNQVYIPQQITWAAADSVMQYVNDIGQITDSAKFRAAAAAYYRRRNNPF